jgi:hypothetical protein
MRAQRPGQQPGRFQGMGGGLVAPGEYVIMLDAGGKTLTKKTRIRYRQGWTVGPVPVVIH